MQCINKGAMLKLSTLEGLVYNNEPTVQMKFNGVHRSVFCVFCPDSDMLDLSLNQLPPPYTP